jgi:hypothetical protein
MPSCRQPAPVPSRHLRYGDAPGGLKSALYAHKACYKRAKCYATPRLTVIPSHMSTYRTYREQPDAHLFDSNPITPFTASRPSASPYAGFPSASNPSYLPPLPSLSSLPRMPSLQSLPRTDSLQGERSLHNITPPSYGRQSYRGDVVCPVDSYGSGLTSQGFASGETPLTRNTPHHPNNPPLHGYDIEGGTQGDLSDVSPPPKDDFRRPRRGSGTVALLHLRSTQSSIDLGSSGGSRPSPPSRLYSDPFDPMPSHNFPMPPSANPIPALQHQAPLAATARSRRYLPPPTSLETLIGRSGMLDAPDGRLPGLAPLSSHLPPITTSNQHRYSCETCGKGFDRPSALTIHMHSHVCPLFRISTVIEKWLTSPTDW